jgi:MFS superfamily sulfate permease-like transporter
MGSKSQFFSLVAFGAVVLVLLVLRPLLMLFPKAALGALVVFAALQLIQPGEFRRLGQFRRTELALALVTTLGVISTNILLGVAIAIGLSVLDVLARISRPHAAVQGEVPGLAGWHDIGDWPGAKMIPGLVIYRFDAPLFFANVEPFKQQVWAAIALETIPVRWLLLNTEAMVEIDSTAAEVLLELQDQLSDRQITLALVRVKQELLAQLQRAGLVERIGAAHIFPTIPTAIAAFKSCSPDQS